MSVTEPVLAQRRPGIYLPQPPDDREKYEYFGGSRRWVFAWLLVASAGVMYGYVHVAERAWAIAPIMWLLLMVMVPPVVVNFWLRFGRPRLTLPEHLATVASYREHGEAVDVFLPNCGEPLPVLDNEGYSGTHDVMRSLSNPAACHHNKNGLFMKGFSYHTQSAEQAITCIISPGSTAKKSSTCASGSTPRNKRQEARIGRHVSGFSNRWWPR